MKKLMTALETVLQAHFMPAFLVQICLSCLLASCNQIELSERPVLISPIEGLDSVLVRQYLDTGLPVVWIKTVNDEEPVYEKREFHADRPFVYLITERGSNVVLFIGKYVGD